MNFHDPDREKIEKIINTEWDMFQQVDNIGGRADCQDDFETFYIMRRSQYDNWTTEMVDAYSDFAARSQEEGRNLVSEKYARMMAYTDLHYFNKHLRDKLPAVPAKNFRLINRIVERLICWEEEMARRYPKLAPLAQSGLQRINTDSLPWRLTHEESLKPIPKSYLLFTASMWTTCGMRAFPSPEKIFRPWYPCTVMTA